MKEQSSTKARKRRIEIRATQRSSQDKPDQSEDCKRSLEDEEGISCKRPRTCSEERTASCHDDVTTMSNDGSSIFLHSRDDATHSKAIIRKVNKYNRYEPGVPMAKEELKKWKKEARRVRNRESAAASRRKVNGRVAELESQVGDLRAKYEEALRRISELEALVEKRRTNSFGDRNTDIRKKESEANLHLVSPNSSRKSSAAHDLESLLPSLTLPLMPSSSSMLEIENNSESTKRKSTEKGEHITDFVSRPIA